ncbi:MAG: type II toxin-antitoxin system VapC family toxin [Ignavibacteria bacterium]|nr:type II toxin-antitoxin system VapC family toxin [Ignavibacteria bacterium]
MRIYLDVCCLNRPFDNQLQDRIRMEAEAVRTILHRSQTLGWNIVNSEVIEFEIEQMPDEIKKQKVTRLLKTANEFVRVNSFIEKRAKELQTFSFSLLDALHLACAESARTSYLLTTDDAFERKTNKRKNIVHFTVLNPLTFITNEVHYGYNN